MHKFYFTTKWFIFFFLVFISSDLFSQSIGIGTTSPNSSAALDISNTGKGLLIPRITSTGITAIANPAKGLMVYDSVKNQLLVNMGTASIPNWQNIVSSSGWGLAGNNISNPSAQFIGNTNNQPLNFRVNNIAAGELNPQNGDVFWGLRSGQANVTGFSNIAIGTDAAKLNPFASHIIAIGDSALFNNSTAGADSTGYSPGIVAIGSKALYANTTGLVNTAIGFQALMANQTGQENVALGYQALAANMASYNTAVGTQALGRSTTGYNNTAIGNKALFFNSTGYSNTAIGQDALWANHTGYFNTAIGDVALAFNDEGTANTATGHAALYNNSNGSLNAAAGYNALYNNTTGAFNTGFGAFSLYNNQAGSANVAVGENALRANSGTLGSYNTAVGTQSLNRTTNSQYNTVIGSNAGSLYDLGYNNTILGANCDGSFTGQYNIIAIGQAVTCTENSQARIGNSATTSIGGYANWTKFSDGRYKNNIKEDVKGLAFILKLRPVTYNLNVTALSQRLNESRGKEINPAMRKAMAEKENITETGFVAQEVEQAAKETGYAFSGVDKPKTDAGLYGLRYSDFVAPMVKAMQEQQQMITDMKKRIDLLEEQNKLLQQRINKKN